MGIRDWFTKKPLVLSAVRSPSVEHPTPLDAIHALIAANDQAGDDSTWVSFDAESDGATITIQVSGSQVNFCTREIDLPGVLTSSSVAFLASRVAPGGRKQTDRTCWTIPDATSQELALVVHAAFEHGFRLGDTYALEGNRNG